MDHDGEMSAHDTAVGTGDQRQPGAQHLESIVLLPAEIEAITGYRMPAKQLEELRRQGFWRARRGSMTGNVILEREHYRAVCGGFDGSKPEPKLRSERLRETGPKPHPLPPSRHRR